MKRLKFSTFARILFTGILLVFIYSKINLLDLLENLKKFGFLEFTFCCALYLLSQVLSAYKWKTLLYGLNIKPSFIEVLKSFFLGMFINSFGLGTIGGDMARVFSLKPEIGMRTSVLASVIADRLQGLIVLLSIGIASLLIFHPPYVTPIILYSAICLAIFLIFGWLVGPIAITKFLPSWIPKRDKIVESLQVFPKNRLVILKITIISFFFHITQMFLAYYIFGIITQGLSFSVVLSSIPFVNVASTLPLSVNGMGVREAVSVYLLSPAGISREVSVAYAAIWVLITTIISGVCGALIAIGMGEGLSKLINKKEE